MNAAHRTFASGPTAALLTSAAGVVPRLHLQHGPIDLIIGAWGDHAAIKRAYDAAWSRFQTILTELVDELATLRQPVDVSRSFNGSVAQRMRGACVVFAPQFITPMAAVAGSVADEVLASMMTERSIERIFVNNGGDIAIHLAAGTEMAVGMAQLPAEPPSPQPVPLDPTTAIPSRHGHRAVIDGTARITAASGVRGVATSGWRGRSLSLGIADSVTVLAATAAQADAAATMIANAVNIDHPAIVRARACDRVDDTDLGARMVTVSVGPLDSRAHRDALDHGEHYAQSVVARRLIIAAVITLAGERRMIGNLPV